MATAILGNAGDVDTATLVNIWKGLPNTKSYNVSRYALFSSEDVNHIIEKEKDLIIFAGHGSPSGLFNPAFGASIFHDCEDESSPYLLCKENLEKVEAKKIIGIWCHASDFAKANNVKGFFSGMFISNPGEAYVEGIKGTKAEDITAMELKFCNDLNELITKNVPMEKWKDILISKADMSDPVTKFNYEGLYFAK